MHTLRLVKRELIGRFNVRGTFRETKKDRYIFLGLQFLEMIKPKTLVRNARYWRHPAPDGLPIPPPWMIIQVSGTSDIEWFLQSGKVSFLDIVGTLQKNGVDPNELRSVLDFGCGCARVTRYWNSFKAARVSGTDSNTTLVRWSKRNIPNVEFGTNCVTPPTSYRAAEFDLVYAISVFTHLVERSQLSWIDELARVLRSGKYLFITTFGESSISKLPEADREKFRSGQLVVKYKSGSGTNLCTAYHPEKYVRESLASRFSVVDFVPQGLSWIDRNQDIYLLRKI